MADQDLDQLLNGGPPPDEPEDMAPEPIDRLDPANRSLADALRLSFRILQGATVLLLIFYALTNFNRVQEQENGMRLTFGRIQNTEPLQPGLNASWPSPIGEFIKVRVNPQELRLTDEFWLALSDDEKTRPFEQINRRINQGLKPGEDGSILTGDANLAHTRWSVNYRVVDAIAYTNNIVSKPQVAEALIRKAVERGVVHGAAVTSLDDVIQSRDTLSNRVKAVAQDFLDKVDSGIKIETVSCTAARPPRPILDDYEAYNKANAEADRMREQAATTSKETLLGVAGQPYQQLLTLIDEYEALVDESKTNVARRADADLVLDRIDEILASDLVGGQVANIIASANQDRTDQIARAAAEARHFQALYGRYQESPDLVKFTEWTASIKRVMDKEFERIYISPDTTMLDLRIGESAKVNQSFKRQANEEDRARNLPGG